MSKKSKKSLRNRVMRAEQEKATKKSPKLDQLRKQREAVHTSTASKGDITMVVTSAVPVKAKLAKVVKLPVDGSIPKALDRINGRSKEQIDALREKLVAKHDKPMAARGITSAAPKASTLTEADKKAIKEIEKQQNEEKAAKATARINKLRESKGQSPVKTKTKKVAKAKSNSKANAENGSKSEEMIAALRKGSTLAALAKISGWTNHSLHGFICSRLRKQMKLKVTMTKKDDGNVYRIV